LRLPFLFSLVGLLFKESLHISSAHNQDCPPQRVKHLLGYVLAVATYKGCTTIKYILKQLGVRPFSSIGRAKHL
tara:strand:+ start:10771 stop:10992 length:222 start_codon:yes stop_codon:yes gene_type:complete